MQSILTYVSAVSVLEQTSYIIQATAYLKVCPSYALTNFLEDRYKKSLL